jgi:hypothetical protein
MKLLVSIALYLVLEIGSLYDGIKWIFTCLSASAFFGRFSVQEHRWSHLKLVIKLLVSCGRDWDLSLVRGRKWNASRGTKITLNRTVLVHNLLIIKSAEIFHQLEKHCLDIAHVKHKPWHFHDFLYKWKINFETLERNNQQQKQQQQQQQQNNNKEIRWNKILTSH